MKTNEGFKYIKDKGINFSNIFNKYKIFKYKIIKINMRVKFLIIYMINIVKKSKDHNHKKLLVKII